MKGENYLYFNGTTAEPNGADKAVMIPTCKVLGVAVGAANGSADKDAMFLSFAGFVNDGNSKGSVLIAVKDGKQKEAMDDLTAAMNSNPSDGFVVIADDHAGVYCSEHITGCTVDSAV